MRRPGPALLFSRRWCDAALLWASTALWGCTISGDTGPDTTEPRSEGAPVVDPAAWRAARPDETPFGADTTQDCDGAGTHNPPVFEIDTTVCDPVTFVQPTTDAVRPGEVLYVVHWHSTLYAPEDSQATVQISLGDAIIYTRTSPIPDDEAVFKDVIRVPAPTTAGTPIAIHVDNHGANTYSFLSFEAGAEDAFVLSPPDGGP